MNTKRILGFVTLPLLAIAGLLLPQGLTGQTEDGAGVARLGGGTPAQTVGMPGAGGPPAGYAPYAPPPMMMVAEPSVAASGMVPMTDYFGPDGGVGFTMTDPTSTHLFGPQVNFDAAFNEGLGYSEEFFRMNALIPWHIVPGQTVMLFDAAAAVTDEGRGSFNGGIIYRNFDQARNRIFGWNVYYDFDKGVNREDGYQRIGAGMETLGKYFDFRMNGYYILGDDSDIISSSLLEGCDFVGHNILMTRERRIETAFEGVDAEAGGPLPFLGHWGINGYAGAYYLNNDIAGDTVGVSARVEALINDATTANFTYTNDDLLGSNAFASLSVTMPRWRTRGWFKPRVMQERLGDQVRRSNRIHTEVARYVTQEAAINPLDGQAYEMLYVDPNLLVSGDGSAERPLASLEDLADRNRSKFDIISVAPRGDNTSTNLEIAGGLDLFAGQQLLGRTKVHRLFETEGVICELPSLVDDLTFLPAITDRSEILPPLITNPAGGPGSYVVSLSDNNVVSGFRIDANGGRGIVSRGRIRDFEITCNTIFNHTDAVVINNARGRGVFEDNIIDGADSDGNKRADNGLVLSAAAGETLEVLLRGNTITDHNGDGMDILAKPGSRIEAHDTDGFKTGNISGILNNVTDRNDRGIRMEARDDAVINASVQENQFNENDRDGFLAVADSGRVVFRSFARNTGESNAANGVFFQYRNGGRFYVLSEDENENGIFDPGEDLNGNGVFDLGFVQNTLGDNGENGLCIFGQGSGRGFFDIGGPDPALGNTFIGNADAGIAVDLTGTARAQMDTMFNLIASGTAADPASLTIILDFIDPAQGTFTDPLGRQMTAFDPTNFGFNASDFDRIAQAVKTKVEEHYHGIVTADVDPRSPIPEGMQLDVDFIIGDTGVDPGFGNEYYSLFIGDSVQNLGGLAGQSYGIGQVRDANGVGPTPNATFPGNLGDPAASVYTNQIASFSPGLNPPDAFEHPEPYPMSDRNVGPDFDPAAFKASLTSGNIDFTQEALGLITSHELGHALSLRHVLVNGAVTPTGKLPIMATPALDGSIQALISPNEFSFSGINPETGTPFQQDTIQQLVNAVGLRPIPAGGLQRDGVRVRASNSARLEPSRFVNNEIRSNTNDGLSVTMQDSAIAEDLDIQGNAVTDNGGRGVHLEARGEDAMVLADRSIGGTGTNTLAGVEYTQSNSITGNGGDGIQVLAANGGTVFGNIRENEIDSNGGNGIALLIEKYGTLDFGNLDENRVVEGNIVTNNGGFGVLVRTESVPGEITTADLITQNNEISNNASGGLFADLTGTNNNPPAIASPVTNSTFDLTIVDEIFDGNGDVGVAVSTSGNTKANVLMQNTSITNTAAGSTFGGDGVNFRRAGSSLLTAVLGSEDLNGSGTLNPGEDVNGNGVLDTGGGNLISANAGDGIATLYTGNNRFDQNQPMSGTINSITWNGNTITGNGGDGVSFRGRGDAQMMGSGMNNIISNNTSNGILVDTREFSTFGDPSNGSFPPPGQRTIFKSNVISTNGGDGVRLDSFDNSRQLVQITSAASSGSSDAHAGAITDGDTVISNNASDGVHVTAGGVSEVDLIIDSGEGQTIIADNGSGVNGGNGVRFDASGNTTSTVVVQETIITGSRAGATEDVNGNGILDFGEDTNRNGFLDTEDANGNGNLDPGEDTNGNGVLDSEDANGNGVLDGAEDATGNLAFVDGNLDIDVENGDGIQFNVSGDSTATLQVGGNNVGNVIQNNEDDGVSVVARGGLSAQGSGATGQARPTITVVENLLGGFDDGLPAGNGGDGVGFNVAGGAFAAPQLPGGTAGNNEPNVPVAEFLRNEIGPIVTATFLRNEMSQNGRRGANIRLTGASGLRDRENLNGSGPGGTNLDMNLITFNNNVARSNAEDGVVFQANARYIENREVLFLNGAPGSGVNGSVAPYDPVGPEFDALNTGTLNGQSAYLAEYLNLRTAQNTDFVALNNEIKNNGTALISGAGTGMTVRVSANAYLSADIQSTRFGGNLEADFFTESFNVGGDPINSLDYINAQANPQPFDFVFLDDTAQLDLRFDDNTGNQIEVTANGVQYTNNDPGKNFPFIPIPNVPRAGTLFQVDGGPFLNTPNNVFSFQGTIQNVRAAFSSGNYFERSISDPLFPNIAFPPPLL